jgi:hypothetical protein
MELRKFIATTIREYLNEQQNVENNIEYIMEEIIAYHRSPKKIYKFNMSNISTSRNRQGYGYGLYFSNIIPNKEYGGYLYTVKLSKIFLLDGNKPVEGKIVNKIIESLNAYDKKSDGVAESAYNGFLFYKTLSRILGGDKNASLFLFNNGIDGLKRDNGGISKNWCDYILFNDDSITIEKIKYDTY